MDHFQITYQGKNWNEDYAYVTDNFGFVLDGATALTDQKFSHMHTDSEWLVQTLGEYLKKHLDNTKKNYFDILKSSVKFVTNKFEKLVKDKKVIDYPSSTISAFRKNNDSIEFYTLGDSFILVEDIFGNIFEIHDSRNDINDAIALSRIEDMAIKNNISLRQARVNYPEIVISGRALRNSRGHQYIFTNDSDAINQGICFSMEEKFVSKIIIVSDGFAQSYNLFNLFNMKKFIKKINNINDAKKIYKKLRRKQKRDKDCIKFPRFKETDDASLVYVKINKRN